MLGDPTASLIDRARDVVIGALAEADLEGYLCALLVLRDRPAWAVEPTRALLAAPAPTTTRPADVAVLCLRRALGLATPEASVLEPLLRRELSRQPLPPATRAHDDDRIMLGVAAGIRFCPRLHTAMSDAFGVGGAPRHEAILLMSRFLRASQADAATTTSAVDLIARFEARPLGFRDAAALLGLAAEVLDSWRAGEPHPSVAFDGVIRSLRRVVVMEAPSVLEPLDAALVLRGLAASIGDSTGPGGTAARREAVLGRDHEVSMLSDDEARVLRAVRDNPNPEGYAPLLGNARHGLDDARAIAVAERLVGRRYLRWDPPGFRRVRLETRGEDALDEYDRATEARGIPSPVGGSRTYSALPRADVLLVVVTDGERDAVFAAATSISETAQPVGQSHGEERTYHDLGSIGGARTLVVQTEMGTATVGGSLSTILTAIGEVRPSIIIMVGIAFGVDPDKQPIGQVLVSKQVQQYDVQRVGTASNGSVHITPRGDKATATPMVLSRLRAAATSFRAADVAFELLLSGEKLVDNHDFRDELRAREPEAKGGEMEGGGLYVAATEKRVSWCIVKAVCDYADGNKRDNKVERQATAAQNAALFVLGAIAAGGFVAREGQQQPPNPR